MGDVTKPFTILIVCQANVCRSPLAEQVMRDHLKDTGDLNVVVVSAGTDALPGEAQCPAARAWSGTDVGHDSVALSKEMLEEADLVLAVDGANRSASAILDPSCRPRLFTVKQAAFLADSPIRPSMQAQSEPLRWLVREWDAQRFLLAGRNEGEDDIPDRHGTEPHEAIFEELSHALGSILAAFDRFATGEPI